MVSLIFNPMVEYTALDRTFAALADPTRRAIVARLALGEANIGDLAAPFPMSFQAVSKHLKVLEGAGLIRRRRQGRTHWLSLDPAPLDSADGWIAEQRRFWEASLDRLAALLETPTRRQRRPKE